MIAVTTPTGSIGAHLVQQLLAAGERVRVIARQPEKLPPAIRERVEVVQGSSDDERVLDRALTGAESLFHVVPPFFRAPNVTDYYLQFTRPVCAAMKRQGVSRIVTVSGIGRRSQEKAGVVSASLRKDVELEKAGLQVRALWCPGFMENMLREIPTLRDQGMFAAPRRADVKAPYVATRDIAASAARLLRDRSWTGAGGLAVLGPEDLTLDEMATITSEVLGRPIRFQPLPAAAYKAQLLNYGASEDMAQGLVDMYGAKDRGLDSTEARSPRRRRPRPTEPGAPRSSSRHSSPLPEESPSEPSFSTTRQRRPALTSLRLHTAQPSLSRQIRDRDKEVGALLFRVRRADRSVAVQEAGNCQPRSAEGVPAPTLADRR